VLILITGLGFVMISAFLSGMFFGFHAVQTGRMTEEQKRDCQLGSALNRASVAAVRDALNDALDPWGDSTRAGQPTITFCEANQMSQVVGTIVGGLLLPDAVGYEFTVVDVDNNEQIVTSPDGNATVSVEGPGSGTLVERQINTAGAKSKPTVAISFDAPDPFVFAVPSGPTTITFEDPIVIT